jgi:hypothetical protein
MLMELNPTTSITAERGVPNPAGLSTAVADTGLIGPVPAPRLVPPPASRQARDDETLIPDERAELSPAQYVERRLTTLLKGSALPVSHVRMARLCRKM